MARLTYESVLLINQPRLLPRYLGRGLSLKGWYTWGSSEGLFRIQNYRREQGKDLRYSDFS